MNAGVPSPVRLPPVPAVGVRTAMPRRELLVRVGALVLAAVLALGSLVVKAAGGASGSGLPAVPGAAVIAPGVLRGGQPQELDFVDLRDLTGVSAVVNLRLSSLRERAVVTGFGLEYLSVPVPADQPPTPEQLVLVADFLSDQRARGRTVYVHDDTGAERVLVLTAMLQVLRGMPLADALRDAYGTGPQDMSPAQRRALVSLSRSASRAPGTRSGPYDDASGATW